MTRGVVPGPLGLDGRGQGFDRGIYVLATSGRPGPVGAQTAVGTRCSERQPVGISAEEGQQVVEAARSFVGAEYYSGGGERSTEDRMDCSGAVWLAYRKAGFPTAYHDSRSFPRNPDFYRVPDQRPQQGDVGQWDGHMLIYDAHAGGSNNGWSARRPGVPFSAQSTTWWARLGTVTWYRYKRSSACAITEAG